MTTLVILFVVIAVGAALFAMAGGMDRVRRVPTRTVVRDAPVIRETPVVRERVVERPVTTERVTERTTLE